MPTATISLNTGATSSSGVIDTYIDQAAPTTGHGSDAVIYGKLGNGTNQLNVLVQFGLAAIPAGATINSATLTIRNGGDNSGGVNGGGYNVAVFRMLRTITGSATWNTYDGTNSWTTGGAEGAGTDRASTATDTKAFNTTTGGAINYTVTADVAAAVAASASNVGWVVRDATSSPTDYWSVVSAQGTDGNRPSLSIDYTETDITAPVLSGSTGTATGATTATVGATTDEGNGTLYAVVTTSATQPSVAQIKAGQNHLGASASWAGSVAVSSAGAKTLNATGLTASTTYYGHLVHTDFSGNNSNRVASSSFTTSTPDTTPPTLTSPTGAATGGTTATGTVSTNENNGTLYFLATTNATETAATVKASGGTQAISSTGTKTVSFTGLSAATTYYAHYVHRDDSGNDSARVSSSSFATDNTATGGGPIGDTDAGGGGGAKSVRLIGIRIGL